MRRSKSRERISSQAWVSPAKAEKGFCMVVHATGRTVMVTAHTTLDGVLDQLRGLPAGNVTLALHPMSLLFATPDHFRALDTVRMARSLIVTFVVNDAHRTGLALAFGYRVRPALEGTEALDASPLMRSRPIPIPIPTAAREYMPLLPQETTAEYETDETPERLLRGARWVRRGLISLLVVTALCAAAGFFIMTRVHEASVTLSPAEEQFSRDVQFAVSVGPTNDANSLRTSPFEATLAGEGDAAATGTTTVPDGTAGGVVTFRSRADGAITIKAGAQLRGQRDVAYIVQSDVTVPGLDFVRGQLGEGSARVRANVAGPVGNLGAGFSAKYSDNVTYISGEISGGTEKTVPVVTEDDIAGVRARIERDLRMRALNETSNALPPGTTAVNDFLTLRPPVVVAQPIAGTQTDAVHVRVTIVAQVPVYQNADFDALVERRLTEAAREAGGDPSGAKRVLPESVTKTKPQFLDVQGPLVRYSARVSGTTRAQIADADIDRLRRALVGLSASQATLRLSAEPLIGKSIVRYGPTWLPARLRVHMPGRPEQIHISRAATP